MSLHGPIISIEDDDDDQLIISDIIGRLGLPNTVRFFRTGLDALQYLATTPETPFLILCDIRMPLMDGIDLRQRINEDDYLRQKAIPFVYYTSTSRTEDLQEQVNFAYQLSVQGFFRKASGLEAVEGQLRLIIEYWQNCLHPNSTPPG